MSRGLKARQRALRLQASQQRLARRLLERQRRERSCTTAALRWIRHSAAQAGGGASRGVFLARCIVQARQQRGGCTVSPRRGVASSVQCRRVATSAGVAWAAAAVAALPGSCDAGSCINVDGLGERGAACGPATGRRK